MKLRIKVVPNSKTGEVVKEGDLLLVKVKEPAREGKANRAVIKALAKHFGVPQDSVCISSGLNGRNKIIEIIER
ncbi:MAG: DUF167 domain-containing protein [Chloroflexi bacterium]|nr:DUF167 domain-containing protein [Chloroflexota bacterium]MBM3153960.1 DUF167 domain-containing protein [Chloroflexota bacterium]MBM3172975.1 DUF167 domain-containing protein [Chloroflexota bacterium]MBM3174780.1 DUF167 domain-containing protein [Chloroflexota bacterium]MBM4450468.1 DUF167 domain-containing protein [Chloroflexota bacterium]